MGVLGGICADSVLACAVFGCAGLFEWSVRSAGPEQPIRLGDLGAANPVAVISTASPEPGVPGLTLERCSVWGDGSPGFGVRLAPRRGRRVREKSWAVRAGGLAGAAGRTGDRSSLRFGGDSWRRKGWVLPRGSLGRCCCWADGVPVGRGGWSMDGQPGVRALGRGEWSWPVVTGFLTSF
jgi:hypothetical protein